MTKKRGEGPGGSRGKSGGRGSKGGRLVAGPGKPRRRGSPEPQLTHHKVRCAWFQARASWPLREAPVGTLVRERSRVRRALPAPAATPRWELAGPTNIGGRMTSIIAHPHDPDVVWAGAAGGGVWKSSDAGRTWRALWHRQPILNIGALAINPQNPDELWCGTGEANLSADSYAGVGLYRTGNGGRSWRRIARTPNVPGRIGAIAVDPSDPLHLLVGGIGYSDDSPGGLYVSRDGGATWARQTFLSASNYWCHAIAFDPAEPATVFATFTERGARSGIWRSRDAGTTWAQLNQGLPAPELFGRCSLALAPSNAQVIYAQAERRGGVLGVFRSDDGGDNWAEIGGGHFASEGQMSYNNAIVVHPADPDHVLCGGVDLHRSTDGGSSWEQVTRWHVDRGQSDYAHADHHALCITSAAPHRVYDANDGGVDVSEDGGETWTNRSAGLAVTMYYDLDVAQSDSRYFGGGTQDNGTLVTSTGGADDHFQALGGDGGWMVFDPTDELHLYASYYNMNIFRFRRSNGWTQVTPPAPTAERAAVWMVYIAMDPSNPRTVFTGSQRVWRTRNDGQTWKAVSTRLDGSPITAIEIAPADPRRIYVGTTNGGLFRSLDGGDTWSADLSSAALPGRTITRLASSPRDEDLLLATVAGTGHGHVYRSDDGGRSWRDIDQGALPDVPHHAVVIRSDAPRTVYVGNDAGVFASPDLGLTWENLSANLPHAMVVDLVYHLGDGTLTAATYGRSLWRLAV